MLFFKPLLISWIVLMAQNSVTKADISIKCNPGMSLGAVAPDQLQNTSSILTSLLQVTAQQIQFSSYEYQDTSKDLVASKAMNPLIHALHMAFGDHLVLRLTPDMIWYVIADGVGQYIKDNSEKMRHVFVDFAGKKELLVRTNEVFEWSQVIDKMNALITNNTKQSNSNLFAAEFTTTSSESLTATYLTRMDSMQNYFSYTVWTLCGIPEIKLMGVRDDWTRLVDKVEELVGLVEEMNVWRQNLKEILSKFVDVYDDKVDLKFWNDIYKVGGMIGSGNPFITGWATNFFPFITQDETLTRNSHALEGDWKSEVKHHFTTNDFNPKLGHAPFVWLKEGRTLNMTFFGGLYGIRYDAVERSVMPVFGYGIYRN